MINLHLLKCQGSDNDFILLDEQRNPSLSEAQRQLFAIQACDRVRGVGADGILFYQASSVADAKMRMFNPDGSEAEMCGNGIRCLGRYAIEQLGQPVVRIETLKAVLTVQQQPAIYPGVPAYETAIEPVSLEVARLPMQFHAPECVNQPLPRLSSHLTFTALSVPNPHIISFVPQIDMAELFAVGQQANQDRVLFPKGVNVSFVKHLSAEAIFVATYERGVGLTQACGTAMSAACFSACWLGFTPFARPIAVYNKGGRVYCRAYQEAQAPHRLTLAGNASFIYTALLHWPGMASSSDLVLDRLTEFKQETADYAVFQRFCREQIPDGVLVDADNNR